MGVSDGEGRCVELAVAEADNDGYPVTRNRSKGDRRHPVGPILGVLTVNGKHGADWVVLAASGWEWTGFTLLEIPREMTGETKPRGFSVTIDSH